MPILSIQHGATLLYSRDLITGSETFHERAVQRDGMLVLNEAERVSLVLTSPSEDSEHRIFIGDVPLSDLLPTPENAQGIALGGQLYWQELPYFESARGQTRLLLESQPLDSATDDWQRLVEIELFILPSKLGEERYLKMAEDLQEVSRSLLVDLYGKSRQTRDLKFSKEGKLYNSREQELASIHRVVDQLSTLLLTVAKHPVSRVITRPVVQQYQGGKHLSPTAINSLCRKSLSPGRTRQPAAFRVHRKIESFDVPEHRVIKAFLAILGRRARLCARAASKHIKAIESDRHLRHIRRGSDPSLYETVDLPRIRRLKEGVFKAEKAITAVDKLAEFTFIKEAKAELTAVRGGLFQRGREYQSLLAVIRRYLLANAVWYEGADHSVVTKLTSRLFEEWCFLRIVDAFRATGLNLREWDDALRQNLSSRFVLDFDRGLKFEGLLSNDLRIRLRFEPWVLGVDSALQAQETLCRGSATDVAWSPDIVIECLKRGNDSWSPIYVVVLDCKYTKRIRNQQWTDTSKYFEIRCTQSRRQVVKQLWLIGPASENSGSGIESLDPAVQFLTSGPTCPPDESVRFRINVVPCGDNPDGISADAFVQFAKGTAGYLRHHFAPAITQS